MGEYIVSARKYRPVTFESVVGQSHITYTLRNAILRKQLAHAYLFCGPRGVGKTTCARILAKSINCLNPDDKAQPCEKCESCQAFNNSRSFNIHELDAASNNSVEYIRSLTEQVRIPPQIGKYSIYIIDEAHMLSTTAFNAFLKTLEEPPAHAIFILATTEKHKIIPTILSRCQIYDFKRIKIDDMVGYLKFISSSESIEYDDESLHIISQKADGCMRDALSMFDKVVSFCGAQLNFKYTAEALNVLDYDTYFHFVDMYSTGDYAQALLVYDSVLQKGFDSQMFLGGLNAHLRNLLMALSGNTYTLLDVTGSVADRYVNQAKECKISFIYDSMNIISQTEIAIKQCSSVRLYTELAILKLCNLSPIKLSEGSLNQVYSLPALTTKNTVNIAHKAEDVGPIKTITASSEHKSVITEVKPSIAKQHETKPDVRSVDVSIKKRSRLGMSIASLVEDKPKESEVQSRIVEDVVNIHLQDEQRVINGCKQYADKLHDARPRLSMAFDKAKIVNGVIELVVANDILSDEILNNKHNILTELCEMCGIKHLDLHVTVDETAQEVKTAPIRDEDKFKAMADKNPNIVLLRDTLSLDY